LTDPNRQVLDIPLPFGYRGAVRPEDRPVTHAELSLQLAMLTARVEMLERLNRRAVRIAWTILAAIAARFGLDLGGITP